MLDGKRELLNQNKRYKIVFKKSPEAQCVVGCFNGWMTVWMAYVDKDVCYYSKPFIYDNLSKYNKLLQHILENKVRN